MPRKYASTVPGATNTGAVTLLQLISSASIRPELYDLIISAGGVAPADNAAEYQLKRLTAACTVTALTPNALDNGDPATLCTTGVTGCGNTATIEGTYTANSQLLDIGINMRASFRWVAREGSEIKAPASTNGLGLFTKAVNSAYTACVTALHQE